MHNFLTRGKSGVPREIKFCLFVNSTLYMYGLASYALTCSLEQCKMAELFWNTGRPMCPVRCPTIYQDLSSQNPKSMLYNGSSPSPAAEEWVVPTLKTLLRVAAPKSTPL